MPHFSLLPLLEAALRGFSRHFLLLPVCEFVHPFLFPFIIFAAHNMYVELKDAMFVLFQEFHAWLKLLFGRLDQVRLRDRCEVVVLQPCLYDLPAAWLQISSCPRLLWYLVCGHWTSRDPALRHHSRLSQQLRIAVRTTYATRGSYKTLLTSFRHHGLRSRVYCSDRGRMVGRLAV